MSCRVGARPPTSWLLAAPICSAAMIPISLSPPGELGVVLIEAAAEQAADLQ